MPNTANLALPYPSLTDAPNIPQHMQSLAGMIDAQLGGSWGAFTPTAAGSTGVTTYGVGPTFACAYKLIGNKTALLRMSIVFGTSPTVSGTMSIGPLPFTVQGTATQTCAGVMFKGTTTPTPFVAYFSGTQVSRLITTSTNGVTSNTVPWTWATGDQIRLSATLELA